MWNVWRRNEDFVTEQEERDPSMENQGYSEGFMMDPQRRGKFQHGAMWAYLGAALAAATLIGVFFIWLVPTIIRSRTKDAFVHEHATAARNFGLTVFLLFIIFAPLIKVSIGFGPSAIEGLSIVMMIAVLYIFVGWIGLIVGAFMVGLGKPFTFVKKISMFKY